MVVVVAGIPSQLTRSSIERSKHSKIHHWVLLQYVAVFPPAVFLQGERIEIDSKATARSVSEKLFAALAEDAAEFAAEMPSKDSPRQKARGPGFVDVMQSKQAQLVVDNEKTVTWLGSPEVQKAVDAADEVGFTTATVGPVGTETYPCSLLGENVAQAAPNSSTHSAESAAEGVGTRPDSPAGATELLPGNSPTEQDPGSGSAGEAREEAGGAPSEGPPSGTSSNANQKGPCPAAAPNALGFLATPAPVHPAVDKRPTEAHPQPPEKATQQADQIALLEDPPSADAEGAEQEERSDESECLEALEGALQADGGPLAASPVHDSI